MERQTALLIARLTIDIYGEAETRSALRELGLTEPEVCGILLQMKAANN